LIDNGKCLILGVLISTRFYLVLTN